MYHQFNFQNSTFYPHSVFKCFVLISEQTAIISLYSINWLVFGLFCKTVESDYYFRRVCLSVCPHGATRLPLDGFSSHFIFEHFSKICWEN